VSAYQAGLEAAKKTTELAPNSWIEWVVLTEALLAVGDTEAAEKAARTATNLRPDLWQPLIALADALGTGGKNAEADATLRRAKAINPENEIQTAADLTTLRRD
jgi:tetratricopeptide (TPR) repeat protein